MPAAPTTQNQDPTLSISHPVGAECFQSVDSRSVASVSTSKSATEAQSAENHEFEYMSYLKYPLPEPTKSIPDKERSVLELLDDEVVIKHANPSQSAPAHVPLGERRKYPFSSPPSVPENVSVEQKRKLKKIKLIPRIETAPKSDGDASASEHVLRPLNPVEDFSSGSSKAERQGELCRKTASMSKGGVSKHVLKPLDLTKRVSPDSTKNDGQEEPCYPTESQDSTKKTAAGEEEDKKKKYKTISAYIMEVKA